MEKVKIMLGWGETDTGEYFSHFVPRVGEVIAYGFVMLRVDSVVYGVPGDDVTVVILSCTHTTGVRW